MGKFTKHGLDILITRYSYGGSLLQVTIPEQEMDKHAIQ